MSKLDVINTNADKVDELDISEQLMDYPEKPWLVHEVVKMQLAGRRAGTHATKNRANISGGGKKPWRQKGTGRARAGSSRSPLWVGGATMFGPQPRSYAYKMPKKKVRSALKSAFSSKLKDGSVKIFDKLATENGKTKEAAEILAKLKAERNVLVLFTEYDEKLIKAFRNIPYVKLLNVQGLNVYDTVHAENILMSQECLQNVMEVLEK
ncbi:ribosomal protein L4/L1e [Flexistipes sinusarabici DSM 4947]|uniref:Large ribosomal subunit protein uL4 n=1 Tax=Flexistipes sinusarabici (strain ATCC 49648 / DSM 4947 / MAS 10) TaxID=717231 RepID=F8E9A0_FLESM|nr:50S ribosomal protein L4 [Flexistipes sinusarabici]AEI14152.1 ribosomal protein L4/L1e [Flexistipes sinusarabici DSM 4947]